MTKKQLIIVGCIVVVVILIIMGIIFGTKNDSEENNKKVQVQSQYDEKTGLYYIRNEVTNEIIYASPSEEELDFYKENPDYNPNPLAPKSTDLDDYIYKNYEGFYNVIP